MLAGTQRSAVDKHSSPPVVADDKKPILKKLDRELGESNENKKIKFSRKTMRDRNHLLAGDTPRVAGFLCEVDIDCTATRAPPERDLRHIRVREARQAPTYHSLLHPEQHSHADNSSKRVGSKFRLAHAEIARAELWKNES